MKPLIAYAILLASASPLFAASIRVTVTAAGPVGLAPAYATFHDGSFDAFDAGTAASAALESLAEVGDTSGFSHPNGMTIVGGGPFAPNGGTASAVFNVADLDNRFTIAAMILPSNDWFVGNDSALDISSLLGGAPVGSSMTIDLTTIWDAGTELEDFAFAPGGPLVGITTPSDPGGGTVQNGVVSIVGGADPFAAFANLQPPGFDTTAIDPAGGTIARVTLEVIPEPTSSLLLVTGVLALGIRRRRG